MKKWKCSVCGYIHTGDEPPEKCPVCGADRSKFVELTSEESVQFSYKDKTTEPASPASSEPEVKVIVKPPEKSDYARIYDFAADMVLQHHMHPISVHIPNGVIPLSVFFAFMAVVFHLTSFEVAACYNMVFVLLAMPVVLFTGYIEWQKHYGGSRTSIFLTKIACGIIVFVSALILVIWWIANPTIASSASSSRWIFFMIQLVMLSAAGLAGYLGGKLVFKD